MKKQLLTLAFAIIAIMGYAQLTEGKISYDMKYSSDDPEMAAYAGMMAGSSMTVYMKDKFSRADIKMGSMMELTTVVDTDTKDALMLMNISMLGMKNGTKFNLDDADEEEMDEEDFHVELTDETKEILGYSCKKAILEDVDGNEMYFWYTEDIQFNKEGNQYMRKEVPGQPLEFEINADGLTINFEATSVETEISKKDAKTIFSMDIPEGYEEKSMEELKAMGRGQ